MTSGSQRGMTLIETIAALALIGLAVFISASLVATYPRPAARLAAQHDLMRVLDSTMESIRSGSIPLESREIPSPIPSGHHVGVSIRVKEGKISGLFEVMIVATTETRGAGVERSLRSMIWRPGS